MNYTFPKITNIAEVLPIIKDKTEFIVAPRPEGYTVVNYVVQMANTFLPVTDDATAILRELRGIMFDTATGNIIRRPMQKFFNANEKEETQIRNIDFDIPHVILEKLDGSFIAPFMCQGQVRFGTKMGLTEVAKPVEDFIATRHDYVDFSTECINTGFTPIFEWTSRKQKIVIDYPDDQLVLLAIRNMITGEYVSYDYMKQLIGTRDIPLVKTFSGTVQNMQDLVDQTTDMVGIEGFVVRFDTGQMAKVKGHDYVLKHKTKDSMAFEKNIIDILVSEKADDMKPFMDEHDLARFNKFEQEFWDGIKNTVYRLNFLREKANQLMTNQVVSRKVYAVDFVQKQPTILHKFLYEMFDFVPENTLLMVKKHVSNNVSTQAKVDEMRWIFKCNWNSVQQQEE